MFRRSLCFVLALSVAFTPSSFAQTVYMKDVPADTGAEPDPDTGPMWISDDIWVRTSPDPGYQPYPFPEASPSWSPLPHENPEYRDPKYSVPNYVYVRVRNHGSTASTGTERLRVYWAKASTGLSWPTQWVDYIASNCGSNKLYGGEITKPRKNAATASAAERDAYRNAILTIGTNPAYVFFGGTDYWHKQNEVHSLGPPNRHGTAAFLPWHREFVNRYEVLLQEFDPTVKLLYWDWTTNPTNSTGGFNFDVPAFMGNSGAGTGGVSIGPPFINPSPPTLAPPSVTRELGGYPSAPTPTSATDTTVLGQTPFPTFHPLIEGTPHNYSHVYIGGNNGDMSSIPTAAKDPFFFLLHANVDRLWAQWQRDPSSLSRLDKGATYGSETTNVNITTSLAPWDGTGTAIQPWTTAGGYIVSKVPADPSVVSPPIYDTAPLTIPVLQPNQAVVIQIPWYPPNPADFSCFGADQGHFCLLARIETSSTPPFGMTFPETTDVFANTKNNDKIVWKNLTVVDNFPGPLIHASILIRNIFNERIQTTLRLRESQKFGGSVLDKGRLFVDLKPELLQRWSEGQRAGQGIKVLEERQTGKVQIVSPEASIQKIPLNPKEVYPVDFYFELPKDYSVRQGGFGEFDFTQLGAPGKPEAIIGGQRFIFDLTKLVLIKTGDQWRFQDDGADPGQGWRLADFDDAKWRLGKADLGFGIEGPNDVGLPRKTLTTYFRHTFDVPDPSFYRSMVLRLKRSDGAVVYLNGKEVHRINLPAGPVDARQPATRRVTGLERSVFFPVKIDPALLLRGRNVVAVEIHQNSLRNGNPNFDLDLQANRADPGFPPEVAFARPPEGALFEPREKVQINLEALSPLGNIRSVSLYVDNKSVGTAARPPYSFTWMAGSNGLHRLRAEVVDNGGRMSTALTSLSVVETVPPTVTLVDPANDTHVSRGATIPVKAQASDRNGNVKQVEFWVREADFFLSKDKLVSTVKTQPYNTEIRNLEPGHYMVWAVAVNDRDATSQSMPVHIMVQ